MATFVDGNVLTAAQMEAAINPPYGQMSLSGDQTFNTSVTISPMVAGILNGITVASNALVIQSAGIYAVGFSVLAGSTAGSSVEFDLMKNGGSVVGTTKAFIASGDFISSTGSWVISLNASDTIGLQASPSGGNIVAKVGSIVTAVRIAST
jgi:hypothetical protein